MIVKDPKKLKLAQALERALEEGWVLRRVDDPIKTDHGEYYNPCFVSDFPDRTPNCCAVGAIRIGLGLGTMNVMNIPQLTGKQTHSLSRGFEGDDFLPDYNDRSYYNFGRQLAEHYLPEEAP